MADVEDFGYSDVEWESTTADNVKLVESEYHQRFEGTIKGQEDIDKKAQYVLTGLIGLVTALVGLTFSQAKNIDTHYLVGLLVLASTFGLGAIFASISLYPRTYAHLGATPSDLKVSAWLPLLKGDEKDALRLCGIRIKEYAAAIKEHDTQNASKSKWLKRAIAATVCALPIAVVSVPATFAVTVFLHPAKATITAPVTTVPLRSP